MKYLVTVNLLIETDNELVDLEEVDTDFMGSLNTALDGLEDTFNAWIPNTEWDEMAMDEEPSEEEAAEGYYLASDTETEEEVEEFVQWTIVDSIVEKLASAPYGTGNDSISGVKRAIEVRDAAFTPTGKVSGSL